METQTKDGKEYTADNDYITHMWKYFYTIYVQYYMEASKGHFAIQWDMIVMDMTVSVWLDMKI